VVADMYVIMSPIIASIIAIWTSVTS
jgi:hypothetical protein